MKKKTWFLSSPSLAVFQIICAIGALNGCGFEVENPGNPDPEPGTPDSKRSSAGESSNAPADNTTSLPVILNCNLTVSKGSLNSSGKSGAIIEVYDADPATSESLVWKNPSTGVEVPAQDLLFTATSMPAGQYSFKFTNAAGKSCNAAVTITGQDISDKVKLTLLVSVPN